MKLKINDVWHLYGKYSVINEQNEVLAHIKLSNGYTGRLLTSIYTTDDDLICEIQSPKLMSLFFKLQIRNSDGNEIGLIQPRIRIDKVFDGTEEVLLDETNIKQQNNFISRLFKWYVGLFGECTFRGFNYTIETSWPFFETIEVKKENKLIMRFNRRIKNPLLDFLVLRRFIPKIVYNVEIFESDMSLVDIITMSVAIRQWVRHRRHHHHEA